MFGIGWVGDVGWLEFATSALNTHIISHRTHTFQPTPPNPHLQTHTSKCTPPNPHLQIHTSNQLTPPTNQLTPPTNQPTPPTQPTHTSDQPTGGANHPVGHPARLPQPVYLLIGTLHPADQARVRHNTRGSAEGLLAALAVPAGGDAAGEWGVCV